jgi:YD repeat-containing protein
MEDNKFIREYDEEGNETHTRYSDGYEVWKEYDEEGNITHTRYSDGREVWW